MSREHLAYLRRNSCYPAFRAFIGIICIIGYVAIAIGVLVSLVASLNVENPIPFLIAFALVPFEVFAIIISKELSLMFFDVADAFIRFSAFQPNGFGINDKAE